MDIFKTFAKKRDLSDQFNDGDQPKQLWKENSASSSSPNSPSDVFQEHLKSRNCMKILLNCFKNLNMQVTELYILAQSNNKKHIKGDKATVRSDWVYQFYDKKVWWLWER